MGLFLFIICQLGLTILIEGTVILLWHKSKEMLVDSLYVNLLTNPIVNLTILLLYGANLSLNAMLAIRIALEINVVFIEAIAYKFMLDCKFKETLFLSFILNLTSFVAGEILGMAGYWKIQELILSI